MLFSKLNKHFLKSRSIEFALLIAISLHAFSVTAQVGTTAFPFLEINNDASSVGLADADVAKLYSPNAFYLNPALLGSNENSVQLFGQFNNRNGIGLGTDWLPAWNLEFELYSPKVIVQYDKFAFGYEHKFFDFGPAYVRTIENQEGEFFGDAYDYSHSFMAAYALHKYIRIGFGLNYTKSVIYDSETKGLSYDIGLYSEYKFDFEGLAITPTLGLSVMDIGQPVSPKFADSDPRLFIDSDPNNGNEVIIGTIRTQKFPYPTNFRFGGGLRFDATKKVWGLTPLSIASYASVSRLLARYDEQGEPYKPLCAIFGSWSAYEQANTELSLIDQFRTQTGIEIEVLEMVALRFGHFYEHRDNGDREYDTFGLKIGYKYFSFDYAKLEPTESNRPLSGTKFYQLSINVPLSLFYSSK